MGLVKSTNEKRDRIGRARVVQLGMGNHIPARYAAPASAKAVSPKLSNASQFNTNRKLKPR